MVPKNHPPESGSGKPLIAMYSVIYAKCPRVPYFS